MNFRSAELYIHEKSKFEVLIYSNNISVQINVVNKFEF